MQFADCSWHFMHFKYVSYMQAEKIRFFTCKNAQLGVRQFETFSIKISTTLVFAKTTASLIITFFVGHILNWCQQAVIFDRIYIKPEMIMYHPLKSGSINIRTSVCNRAKDMQRLDKCG